MKNFLKFWDNNANVSYSQSGEDRIISFIFEWIQLKTPTYLDIGAHHPSWLSNTYFFYNNGSNGVCIEPDPYLCKDIIKKRSRDICLNVGIGSGEEKLAEFYVMTSRSLNTFSKLDADTCAETNNYGMQKIEEILYIPLRNVNDIVEEYFNSKVNLVSIDVEGLDFEIIKNFDFIKFQPEVFCIETMRRDNQGKLIKNDELIKYMEDNRYSIYADTFINTIFINSSVRAQLN